MLEDIAVLTGGQAITEDLGRKLENLTRWPISARPRPCTVDKDHTTIVEGAGDKDASPAGSSSSGPDRGHHRDYDREKLKERLAKLVGGVAVIKVGAATEVEMKEKKARVEDALTPPARRSRRASSPAAASRCCAPSACAGRAQALGGDRQQFGVAILRRAIEEPLRQIAANAGVDGSIVISKVKEGQGVRLQRRRPTSTRT
jgi:chaperonin GroEL